ncbi:NAD(P)-binding domain-containing protein [Fulvivirga ulvae]|uniref:NADPH-dependent F420 reductase n=1 Tax=Fulvivirga ulvae TaxID=2904245 RepID=UPI001F21502E|nr:NAD(P)-binding domain-containing protein [Fulvivirga ulvae]UII31784.1 NAD(P)-binding domain-containing protein [Fulvivirga ulvae]
MKKHIGILGSGTVGQALAAGFIKYGYQVTMGTGHPEKLSEWKGKAGSKGEVGSFNEAASAGDIIVLAVKGRVAKGVLEQCGLHNLKGKIIIDATNPISDEPPANGVLKFFTSLNSSLMEQLQSSFRESYFVKAFNSVGAHLMVNPDFGGEKPTMFICGNNADAKVEVKGILDLFGWETEDMGKDEAARAIEPLCILWCIPGFSQNQWSHAFRLLKK